MQRVKEYRQKLGLNQRELATMLGVNRSTVTKWENNKSYPKFKSLNKLSNIFSCNIEDIFFTLDTRAGEDLNE